ncbi:protein of unknown function [Methylorubrum extorquens]|uniref:Uncharacterized protein n=1 Tax=Methylorubrum extorquens TaxID=408 RepID=A0A2N9AQ55_METEX|nr:protein of unknown function [Methylorubrum extorquens]
MAMRLRRGRARAVPALLLPAHAPGARLPNPIVAAPVDLARSPRRRDRPGVSPEIQLVGRLRGGQCRQTTQERLHPPAENPPDCKALRRHPLWIRIANNAAHRPAPHLWTAYWHEKSAARWDGTWIDSIQVDENLPFSGGEQTSSEREWAGEPAAVRAPKRAVQRPPERLSLERYRGRGSFSVRARWGPPSHHQV